MDAAPLAPGGKAYLDCAVTQTTARWDVWPTVCSHRALWSGGCCLNCRHPHSDLACA